MKLSELRWPQELAARLGVSALVPVVVVGLLVLIVPRLTGLPEGVVIRAADVEVTEQEFQQRVDALQALYGIMPPKGGPARDSFTRETAKAVAIAVVIEEAARDRDIAVSDKAAQDAVTQLIEQNFAQGGRDAFVQLLGDVGASMQNVLDEIKRQRTFVQLFDQVTGGVPEVTEADARAAYDARRDQMQVPEQRRLSNIVVDSREVAEEVLAKARSEADFGALVTEYSLDQSTRDAAGDLGFVMRAQLQDPYAQAAFSAPPGELFGPVQTESGWNVGKVTEVRPPTPLAFRYVQEQLRASLRGEREIAVWNDWLAAELEKGDPEYAETYLPAEPDALPTASPSVSPPGR